MQTSTLAYAQNALIENIPNAKKLLASLRHLDYSNLSAICDLVDNSIDAGASTVHVQLIAEGKKTLQKIVVWDDGRGMDWKTLDQAMRLGSETEKNPQYDLGKYGMGLVTASISIGEKLEVCTLKDNQIFFAAQDLEEIRQTNKFLKQLYQPEVTLGRSFVDDLRKETHSDTQSGTCVVISNIDRWGWIQLQASEKHLKLALGRVFRKFIAAGKKLFVNGSEVQPVDPIHDFEPELLADEFVDFKGEKISLKLYEIKNYGRQINTEKGINQRNQGFYILRNNREISGGETLGLFTKHNDLNFFRVEFSFPGIIDDALSGGFTKQSITSDLPQGLADQIKAIIDPYTKAQRKKHERQEYDSREKKEDYSEVAKLITQNAHLLKTPVERIDGAKKDSGKKRGDAKKETEVGAEWSSLTSEKDDHTLDFKGAKVVFGTKTMSKVGPLYEADFDKGVTFIYWNVDHPFYAKFIIPYEANKNVIYPISFLIYSLASAELRSMVDSDSEKIIEHIRADLSQNLRVLMSN